MGIKFYKEGTQYVLGDSALDYVPAGLYYSDVHTLNGLDYLKITPVGSKESQWDHEFSVYEDSNGDPYASISALMTAVKGFFAEGVQSVSLSDPSGNTLLPSGTPVKVVVELTRPADIIAYAVGDSINSSVGTPVPLEFPNASIGAAGGGFLGLLKVESNITTLASGTLRLWFFNDVPTGLVGDNVAHVNTYANSSKRCFYIDVTFDALLAGSDTVFGQTSPLFNEYVTIATSLYCIVQTLSAFTPTSGGKIKISLSLIKIA